METKNKSCQVVYRVPDNRTHEMVDKVIELISKKNIGFLEAFETWKKSQ